jgi:very-short-patch-repair endonuclease
MAACLWAGPSAVVSHRAAGVLWTLDGVTARQIEITVPRTVNRRSPIVSVHWSAVVDRVDRTRLDGIPVTSATRTLIDLAGTLSTDALELALEDAFRRGIASPRSLARRLSAVGGTGRAGAGQLRRLLERRSGGRPAGSAAELRLERLLIRHGLPRPVRQYPVTIAGRTIFVDLAYPDRRLAIEYDSLRWHTGRAKLENDADRRNLLGRAGWDLVTVTHTMLAHAPERTVATVRDAWISAAHRSCAETVRIPYTRRA